MKKMTVITTLVFFIEMLASCSNPGFGELGKTSSNNSNNNKSDGNSDSQNGDGAVNEPIMVGGAFLTCGFVDPTTGSSASRVSCSYESNNINVPLGKGTQITVYSITSLVRTLLQSFVISDWATTAFVFDVNTPSTSAVDLSVDVVIAGSIKQTDTATVPPKGTVVTPPTTTTATTTTTTGTATTGTATASTVVPTVADSVSPELTYRDALARLVAAGGTNFKVVTTWGCKTYASTLWFQSKGYTGVFVDDGGDGYVPGPNQFIWTCASQQADIVYRADCAKGAKDYFSCVP